MDNSQQPNQPQNDVAPASDQDSAVNSENPATVSEPQAPITVKTHEYIPDKKPKSKKWLIILLLVVAAVILVAVWFVWHGGKKAEAPAANDQTTQTTISISTFEECTKQTGAIIQETSPERCLYNGKTFVATIKTQEETPAPTETKPADPTADWKTYTAKNTTFSVKYPKTYLTRDCSEDGNASYFGSSEALLAICNSGKTGQIYFGMRAKGDFTLDSLKRPVNPTYESEYKYEDVTVNGKKMVKTTSVLKAGEMTQAGTKIVTYDYVAGNNHISAAYQQSPSEPDSLAVFDQMIATWTIK